MHIFFFFRGVNQYVELFKSLIQGQFWQWERTDLKTGKKVKVLVQGALRPSYLGTYEYIFPEECLSEVIAVLGLQEDKTFRMNAVRKMMGLEKIPKKNWEESKNIQTDIMVKGTNRGIVGIKVAGTGCCLIGMKRDRRGEMYGFNQEAL